MANPNVHGGLAIGVCGHIPQGSEVHTIRLTGSVMYNSNNGLVGDCTEFEDVEKGVKMVEGSVFGIKHDVCSHSLDWYYNQVKIGTSRLKKDCPLIEILYPVFALYVPDQSVQVQFHSGPPPFEGDSG